MKKSIKYSRVRPDAGFCNQRTLPRGPNGRALCRKCGIEVPKGRRTFCSNKCVHDWKLTTDPQYLRQHVFKRDSGICKDCGCDTESRRKEIDMLLHGYHPDVLAMEQGLEREKKKVEYHKKGLETIQHFKKLGFPHPRRTWWEADHVVAVVEGGGCCGLNNIETVCVPCHKKRTAALAARRKQQRQNAKNTTS